MDQDSGLRTPVYAALGWRAAGDVLHLAEPPGEALQAEDLAAVYSVGRGDEFVVQTVAEVRRDATGRAVLWAPDAFTAQLGDETLPAEGD